MPSFEVDYIDIEPYEFVDACRPSEIRELIVALVEDGFLPESTLNKTDNNKNRVSMLEGEFLEKMDKLSQKYYILSKEDELILETLFKKYI